jgi:hypothetical protein
MLIHCLIERDGDTTVTRGGVNYVFRQNKKGHAICEVQNDDHARIFLRMGSKTYRPYGETAEMHAVALKMIPKQTAVEEDEEDGEIFEESVGIAEGREAESAVPAAAASVEEAFPIMESAEEAAEQGLFPEGGESEALPETGEDEEAFAEPGEDEEAFAEPGEDPLVRAVAARLLKEGGKGGAAKELQKQFDLPAAEAKRIVDEVSKK